MGIVAKTVDYCQVNTSASLTPNVEAARAFLTALDESAESFCFRTFPDRKDVIGNGLNHRDSFDDLAALLARENAEGRGVFVTINAGGTKNVDINRYRAVWLDADKPEARPHDLIREVGADPHFLIESSPGKFHLYFLVAPGLTELEFRSIQRGIANTYGGDTAVSDPARVMRLPGFWHQKNPAAPFQTRILEASGSQPLALDFVRARFPRGETITASSDTARAVAPAAQRVVTIDDHTRAELESALSVLDANDRETWVNAGLDLRELGEVGRDLWMQWSATSQKFKTADAEHKWQSFRDSRSGYANVFKKASAIGWRPPVIEVSRQFASTAEEGGAESDTPLLASVAKVATHGLPSELMKLPGALNDVMQWMLDSAESPLPEMAAHAAVAFGSIMAGQLYEGPTGLRSNLNMIGLARSTFGKDHPRRCLKYLISECGERTVIGGSEITSGQSFVSKLADNATGHRAIYVIDEIDGLLKKTLQRNAPAHQREIGTRMMELYSASNDPIYSGPDRADRRENATPDIPYPHLTFLGFTTPDRFWEAVKGGDVRSGFLNRMLVCRASDIRPKRNVQKTRMQDYPKSVVEWAKLVRDPRYHAEHAPTALPANASNPVLVTWKTEKAAAILDAFLEETYDISDRMFEQNTGLDDAVGRWYENALKLALIAGVAKYPHRPVIDEECASWAVGYAKHCGQSVLDGITSEMFDGEFDRAVQQVRAYIAKTGERGATLSAIGNYCRAYRELNESTADQVFKRLTKTGMVAQRRVTRSNGRTVDVWVALASETEE